VSVDKAAGSLDGVSQHGEQSGRTLRRRRQAGGDIYQKHPGARPYQDFRKMFDQTEKQIDAVLVATPDHTHAVASVAAMQALANTSTVKSR